jgi:hypothetical protein
MVIDRWSRTRIFQGLMLFLAASAVALWLLTPLGLPVVPYAIYLASYALDIAGALVFWVLASEYFTTLDLKRSTVALAMGLAFGGLLGGAAITLLYEAMAAADLLLLLPPLFLVMAGQTAWLGRSLEPIGELPAGAEHGAHDEAGLIDSLRRMPALVLRYRLVLLMAASLSLVTVLYCFQEYLVFTIYAAAFPDPDDLGRFLAMLFAGLQLVEFALLYAVSRPLTTRAGPVLRNAVFPMTTLASLGGFALIVQLPAAVLCHGNIEAGANAIYEPTRTLNLMAFARAGARAHRRRGDDLSGIDRLRRRPSALAAIPAVAAWNRPRRAPLRAGIPGGRDRSGPELPSDSGPKPPGWRPQPRRCGRGPAIPARLVRR